MKCQVKSCKNRARWKQASIVMKLNVCNDCRNKLAKDFEELNGIKAITWYYYKSIK